MQPTGEQSRTGGDILAKARAAGDSKTKLYSCPNCGKRLAMSEKCSCDNPVTFIKMIGCKSYYDAYIDKNGNIWRLNK